MTLGALLAIAITVWILLHVSVTVCLILIFLGSFAERILEQSVHPRLRRRLARHRPRGL